MTAAARVAGDGGFTNPGLSRYLLIRNTSQAHGGWVGDHLKRVGVIGLRTLVDLTLPIWIRGKQKSVIVAYLFVLEDIVNHYPFI